jgi:uncharacterized protein YjlB
MPVVETIKRAVEQVTGYGKPSKHEVLAAVRARKPRTVGFIDDGVTPNNSALPLVIYKGAVRLAHAPDPAALFEELFKTNRWEDSWRNGIYSYLHYHSRIHEVLGIARGQARVRFGGNNGKELDVKAGDVAVLPAGTGHQLVMASEDLLVVGAYPPAGTYDLCRGTAEEHARALKSIPRVPLPEADPVFGPGGPLMELWRP